jgi:hypothetical protein
MMTHITSFRRKLVIGAILCFCGGILLPVWGAIGDPLSINEIITFEADGLFVVKFTAQKSFNVEWELVSGRCHQKPTGGFQKFYFYVPDFAGASKNGFLINKDNLTIFKDAGNCNQTESYVAGTSYTAYLVNANNLIFATDTEATIKADRLRDKDEEPAIDNESIFTSAQEDGLIQWTNNFYLTYVASINIGQPIDGSELISTFDMTIGYDNATSFEKIMIIFESWEASSTCPNYPSAQWDLEYDWFIYQSLPYFSEMLTISSGTTTMEISNLATGVYNCVKCYFINETTGAISDALCPSYNITIVDYTPPEEEPTYYLPISDWEDYYASNSERFTTSTPLFATMAGVFEPIISWIGNTALGFQTYFDPDVARAKGTEMGNAIPVARGYVESIDDFFGGLPISSIFIFYVITALVIFVYRLVKGILTIVIP